MTTNPSAADLTGTRKGSHDVEAHNPHYVRSVETKPSFKTTELIAYVAAVIGVLIASQVVGTGDGHDDYFRADKAWFYIVLLTIGYLVSRGLAKAGSREPGEVKS